MLGETGIDQSCEFPAAAHRICDRQAKPRALLGEKSMRRPRIERRRIQTDAGAANCRVAEAAEAQIQINGFLKARKKITRVTEYILAARFVADNDDIRLTAVQQAQ